MKFKQIIKPNGEIIQEITEEEHKPPHRKHYQQAQTYDDEHPLAPLGRAVAWFGVVVGILSALMHIFGV